MAGVEPTFPPLRLKAKAELCSGTPDVYVLAMTQSAVDPSGHMIAAADSRNCATVLSAEHLHISCQIDNHSSGIITGLQFSSPEHLWTSSTDGTLKSWDFRTASKHPVSQLQGYNSEPLNSVSINTSGNLLAGGTDKVGEDASIYLWDIRMSRDIVGQFTQAHSDDITQVLFSPTSSYNLASGSTDGLVCLYDVSTMQEDDALLSVKNSESSVSCVGFFGPSSESVYCVTHQETFYVWDVSEAEPLSTITHLKTGMKEQYSVTIDYVVDCCYQQDTDRLFLIAGDHGGGLRVLHVNLKEVRPVALLAGGHSATVRKALWNQQDNSIISGGEDGILCIWSR